MTCFYAIVMVTWPMCNESLIELTVSSHFDSLKLHFWEHCGFQGFPALPRICLGPVYTSFNTFYAEMIYHTYIYSLLAVPYWKLVRKGMVFNLKLINKLTPRFAIKDYERVTEVNIVFYELVVIYENTVLHVKPYL